MLEVAAFLAVSCTALFAGAALYINLVEHPARMELDTAAAVAQWAPSYHRATFMQAPLAALSFFARPGGVATGGRLELAHWRRAYWCSRAVYLHWHHADQPQAP